MKSRLQPVFEKRATAYLHNGTSENEDDNGWYLREKSSMKWYTESDKLDFLALASILALALVPALVAFLLVSNLAEGTAASQPTHSLR